MTMPLSHELMSRPFGEIGRSVNPPTAGIGIRRAHDGRGAGVGVDVAANVGFTEEKLGGGLVGIGDPVTDGFVGDGRSEGVGDGAARPVADGAAGEGVNDAVPAGDASALGSTVGGDV